MLLAALMEATGPLAAQEAWACRLPCSLEMEFGLKGVDHLRSVPLLKEPGDVFRFRNLVLAILRICWLELLGISR